LLGLALVVAALLVAGFGVSVGIGILAGVLLGWMVVIAFLAMNPRSGGFATHTTWSGRGGFPDESVRELMQRHGQASMRVAGVDASALARVMPVAEVVEAGGLRLELVALEIREDGAVATIVTHARPPIGSTGHFIEAAVNDDVGTRYFTAGQGTGQSMSGTGRYEIRLSPAPPAAAHRLTVRIDAFLNPFPGPGTDVRGPWEFVVAL
jgi:hypothetical protein